MSKRPFPERSSPALATVPFSRPLEERNVPDGGLDVAIEATADERARIVAETGLVALNALAATYTVERRAGGRLSVAGRLAASITQTCVVSLEPFDSEISREIELEFAPQPRAVEAPALPARSRRRAEAQRDEPPPRPVVVPGNDDQQDPPDQIVDGRIDLGAVALEFLVLSLELYPRKPGVHFADVSVGDKDEEGDPRFAALHRLKDPS